MNYQKSDVGEVYPNNLKCILNQTYFENYNLADYFQSTKKRSVYNLILDLLKEKRTETLMQKRLFRLVEKYIPNELFSFIDNNRSRLSIFQQINPSLVEMKLIMCLVDNNVKFNAEQFKELIKHELIDYKKLDFAIKITHMKTIEKLINYLPTIYSNRNDFSIWHDYLRLAKKLGYDLSKKDISFPKNLITCHDKANAQYTVLQDSINNKIVEDMYDSLYEKYYFLDKKYMIIPPRNADEIIQEGKNLKHCVGSYIERIINSETTILFLR